MLEEIEKKKTNILLMQGGKKLNLCLRSFKKQFLKLRTEAGYEPFIKTEQEPITRTLHLPYKPYETTLMGS